MQHTVRFSFFALILSSIAACDSNSQTSSNLDSSTSSFSGLATETQNSSESADWLDPQIAIPALVNANLLLTEDRVRETRNLFFPPLYQLAASQPYGSTVVHECDYGGTVTFTNQLHDIFQGSIEAHYDQCDTDQGVLNGQRDIHFWEQDHVDLGETAGYTNHWYDYTINTSDETLSLDGSMVVTNVLGHQNSIENIILEGDATLNSTAFGSTVVTEFQTICDSGGQWILSCKIDQGTIEFGDAQRYSVHSLEAYAETLWQTGAVTQFIPLAGDDEEIRLYSVDNQQRISTFDANQFERHFQFDQDTLEVSPVMQRHGDVTVSGITTRFDTAGHRQLSVLTDASKIAVVDPVDNQSVSIVDIDSGDTSTVSFDSPVFSLHATSGHDAILTGHDGHIYETFLLAGNQYPQARHDVGIGQVVEIINDRAFRASDTNGNFGTFFYDWTPSGEIISTNAFYVSEDSSVSSHRYSTGFASLDDHVALFTYVKSDEFGLSPYRKRFQLQESWKFVSALDNNTLLFGDGTLVEPNVSPDDSSLYMDHLGQLSVPVGLTTFDSRIVGSAKQHNSGELLYAVAPVSWTSSSWPNYFPDPDEYSFHNGASSLWLGSVENPSTAREIPLPMSTHSSLSMPFEVVDIISGSEPHQFFITGRWQTHSLAYSTVVLELDISALDD